MMLNNKEKVKNPIELDLSIRYNKNIRIAYDSYKLEI